MASGSNGKFRDLSPLIGSLYDAVDQPDHWTEALDDIGDALGGAALVSSLHRPGGMAFGVSNRLDPEADQVLRSQYASPETNPLMAAMPRLPVLTPVARENLMDDASYLRSGLFNDVFRTQGYVHAGLSCLARENRVIIPCGVLRRTNREFDTECFELYNAILPHLRRALELTVRFADQRAACHHIEAIANAGDDGYIVTDASARVLYSNATAERILSSRDGLCCRKGVLCASRPAETSKLRELIAAAALRFDYLGGDMRVARAEGATPWAMLVLPDSEPFSGFAGNRCGSALAMVRVVDLERRTNAPEARMTALFGLSGAEAAIAVGLMEGGCPEEIAERRNLRITTVRTHIRSIYLKTGTCRQTELIRLLLQIAGHVRDAE